MFDPAPEHSGAGVRRRLRALPVDDLDGGDGPDALTTRRVAQLSGPRRQRGDRAGRYQVPGPGGVDLVEHPRRP